MGDALDALRRPAPDLRIVNLETVVTASGMHGRAKPSIIRANAAPEAGVRWLLETLNREGRQFGTRVARLGEHELLLVAP